MAPSPPLARARPGGRRLQVAISLLVLVAVAAALLLTLARRARLDAEDLEAVLGPAIASATRGLYGIEIGSVEGGIGSRDLVVHDVRVAPRPEALERLAAAGDLPALRFVLEVDRFEIRGVDRAAVMTGRGLLADRIDVSRPTIHATFDAPSHEPPRAGGRPPASADDVADWVDEALQGVPEVHIGTIDIRDGSSTVARAGASAGDGFSVGKVEMTFENLHIHEGAGHRGYGSLFSDDVRVEASAFDLGTGSGPSWQMGTLSLSTGEGSARLTDVALDPGSTVPEYLARTSTYESDRKAFWFGRVEAEGIEFQRLIERLDLHMTRVVVAGFRVEILDDGHKPSSPPDRDPARMPHDLIRELDVGLDVQTLQLREGYVSYSERHPEAPLPGTITFEDVTGTARNLSNHPGRMSEETPAVWNIDAAIYGTVPLSLTAIMPLLAPPPSMRVEGRVDPFAAELLDPILVPLTGTELRGGEVLGVAFELDYAPQQVRGSFRAEYRGLRLGPVDRTSGQRDLKDVLVGFIASHFVIRNDNVSRPGEPARAAAIRHPIDPHDSFFKILWQPLRDGAREIVLE